MERAAEMATKQLIVCDVCGDEMTYCDGDGDEHVAGIRAAGGPIGFKVHERHRSGHSGWPVRAISGGDFCSFACFETSLQNTLDDLRRYKKGVE
jgi:hypothetical protein